ncbi:tautomerase family protein [Phyllobacterium endophyticum]|jgi:phenylpyruvate tautomerase PptA (4-oxalocrotonate tautomerase family)|uniref:Tautomerase family protein n=1 Tax=Phyllobacterium endophyticum TaxID=1149773 RepID=A0A2P7ANI1_9HYPH|nr:tautomerase family protein [Phyllobacterium endophyticum]MBB3233928.1 phenylpyruvate tautomerase PptA (4-oxalocrotonate tautomerase family) [Phyllobacterium endophyticum]PSH55766.1 tautomerase family protein [Phyllobacterium endophyticum]TXR47776.1 tautomerase family protein [Phyllobacterium endophyticum]TYR43712.1 tautomerase family protein [Phyllobacterium endophyticum]
MPFTRISLLEGKSPEYLKSVSESLHKALVEAFNVPADDRFQAIQQFRPGELIFDRNYFGGPRSDDFMMFAINIGRPRDAATKQAFYKRLVTLLAEAPGVRPEDVMIIISTSSRDEWSFSNGEAQLLENA